MNDLPLIETIKTGDYAGAEKLIMNGMDINHRDDQGWAALNYAAGKGELSLVKLLVENGADLFNAGRDQRTPYAVALAAGQLPVARYLRDAEENALGVKPSVPQRKYYKAFRLSDLRMYPNWNETRDDRDDKNNGDASAAFADDGVVFLRQDFTVTSSPWQNEDVIFNAVDSVWEEFCINSLKFKSPDDLDLIVPAGSDLDSNT